MVLFSRTIIIVLDLHWSFALGRVSESESERFAGTSMRDA